MVFVDFGLVFVATRMSAKEELTFLNVLRKLTARVLRLLKRDNLAENVGFRQGV